MRFSSLAVAATGLLSYALAAPSQLKPRQSALKFAYGSNKVRGVNLGGVSNHEVFVLSFSRWFQP